MATAIPLARWIRHRRSALALRDLFAEAVGRLPQADPERCVHSLAEVASCRRCVDACPLNAWALDDDALGIDTARCDGCGLCVAHCPEGALSLAPLSTEAAVGRMHAILVCSRASPDPGGWALPCVNAVGFRLLRDLYRDGLRRLTLQTGTCRGCPRDDAQGLVQRVETLNRILQQRGLPAIEITSRDDAFPSGGDRSGAIVPQREGLSRRGFLQRMIGGDATQKADLPEVSPTQAWLPAPSPDQPALYTPRIDVRRCNGCDACARTCPHGALALSPTRDAYLIVADACTGCSLCADVCNRHAIRVDECGAVGASRVPLSRRNCRACGAEYHRPQTAPDQDGGEDQASLCQVCSQVNHHRNLFQVL